MLQELSDPFVEEGITEAVWRKVRPFLGRQKRRMFPWLVTVPPSPKRVVGFMGGAVGPLTKRALLIYLVEGFDKSADELGALPINVRQSRIIAEALNRLGYTVDVVDWQDHTFVPASEYDVCVGMHYPYGRLLPQLTASKTFTIYYATGAYWEFENSAEADRCEYLKRRRGIDMKLPVRLTPNDWVQRSDAIIALGNEFNARLYRRENSRVFAIDHATPPSAAPEFDSKDFESARRNFVCLVGTGLLHKGVDLVLEAFSDLPDLHLWLCANLRTADEREFTRAYRRELYHTPNIHPIGLIGRRELDEMSRRCFAMVHPSCSEGMPGALLDAMARGLVPLVSRESGVDTEDFGVTLAACTVEEIRRRVIELSEMPLEACRRMSERAYETASTRYTLQRYAERIEDTLRSILAES